MVEADEVESIDFKWGKKRGLGGRGKNIQFYGSFTFDGVEYNLYDSVYLYKDDETESFIGKLIKIWEAADKSKKVKVLWFFRPCEISNYLGTEKIADNELFLAAGEGLGLANINPLESIAGKCNVVCILKDSRNTKPLSNELQMADYIFYRIFDVGQCKIMEELDEKIAGVDVKFLLNSVDSQKSNGVLNLESDKKEVVGNALAVGENVILSNKNASGECNNVKTDDSTANAEPNMLLAAQECTPGENPASRVCEQLYEMGNASHPHEKISADERSLSSKAMEIADVKPLLVRKISPLEEKYGCSLGSQIHDMENNNRMENMSNDKINLNMSRGSENKSNKATVNQQQVHKQVKERKDSDELDNRPSKKAKLVSNDKSQKTVHKLNKDSSASDVKHLVKTATGFETDNGPSEKPKPEDNLIKIGNSKFPKPCGAQASNEGSKFDNQILEVTQKPDIDKMRWFNLTWEQTIKFAAEHGRLVLFQNLDPSYTSAEVEAIVWRVFGETCKAKMIQQIAFSNPHSGQAFVVLETKNAAEKVVRKLDEGCLLLPNARPLVGSIASPCFPVKQSTFVGNLVIDRPRLQIQREMREAVSTSHCSQPNTLEYEMAMEWCLLQQRSGLAWRKLYERQAQEMKKLKGTIKRK